MHKFSVKIVLILYTLLNLMILSPAIFDEGIREEIYIGRYGSGMNLFAITTSIFLNATLILYFLKTKNE